MISIAIAYYNRKAHFLNTLRSMKKSKYKDFEVIVVDDGSDDVHRIKDLEKEFGFLRVIRIEKHEKRHTNPCVPFNIAIGETKGDIIIIQNPETLHYNDVLDYTANHIDKNKYLAFTTTNKDIMNVLNGFNWNEKEITDVIKIHFNDTMNNQWYCHRLFRPEAYNFCTAITREDLKELNGFDERYAFGIERDDVEFLTRIKRKGMNIVFVDDVIVIHQKHALFNYQNPRLNELRNYNHRLFAQTTAIENIIKVNPTKTIIQ